MTIRNRRICYMGHPPDFGVAPWPSAPDTPHPRIAELEHALGRLSPLQREIIERRFWRGHSQAQISRHLEIPPTRTRNELQVALAQIRRLMADRPIPGRKPGCQICAHPERQAIDRLLRTKRASDTWRGYLKTLRDCFGVHRLPAIALEAHLANHSSPRKDDRDVTRKCTR